MDRERHWEEVWSSRSPDEVSWYAPRLERSLWMIREVANPQSKIVDVGGGASTLVDDLLDLGYENLSVLDISGSSLAVAKRRLGERAAGVRWITADVVRADLPAGSCDVWHDRAVFHFLTEPADRRAYAALAGKSLRPGGHLIIATFALEGPPRCSGLDVVRYSAETLSRELGGEFVLEQELKESHWTPAGLEQHFLYCSLRHRGSDSGNSI